MIPVDARTKDWPRKVANDVNRLLVRVGLLETADTFTFTPIAEPSDPVEGMTYMDSTSHKLRTWDGSQWNDHW
jgi:hypothetical protein